MILIIIANQEQNNYIIIIIINNLLSLFRQACRAQEQGEVLQYFWSHVESLGWGSANDSELCHAFKNNNPMSLLLLTADQSAFLSDCFTYRAFLEAQPEL